MRMIVTILKVDKTGMFDIMVHMIDRIDQTDLINSRQGDWHDRRDRRHHLSVGESNKLLPVSSAINLVT